MPRSTASSTASRPSCARVAREWRRLPHSERVAVLRATERLIENHKLFLAATISRVWSEYEF